MIDCVRAALTSSAAVACRAQHTRHTLRSLPFQRCPTSPAIAGQTVGSYNLVELEPFEMGISVNLISIGLRGSIIGPK